MPALVPYFFKSDTEDYMARLVDVEDVRTCVKLGIKYDWTLVDFLESMDEWDDFVEADHEQIAKLKAVSEV